MSVDRKVTEDTMEILEDGRDGYSTAAEKVRESDRPDLAPLFEELSEQRSEFYLELEALAAAYGDEVEEDGSLRASVHRAWMTVKDTLSGSDPDGLIDVALQGEDHAVGVYKDALAQEISDGLREMLDRQLSEIQTARGRMSALNQAN